MGTTRVKTRHVSRGPKKTFVPSDRDPGGGLDFL